MQQKTVIKLAQDFFKILQFLAYRFRFTNSASVYSLQSPNFGFRLIDWPWPLFTPVVQKLYRCEHGVFSSRMCVHSQTLLHTSNKILGHRKCLSVTKCLKSWMYQFQRVHHLQQWDTAARIQYCHLFHCSI
jgi:hypothetical protein